MAEDDLTTYLESIHKSRPKIVLVNSPADSYRLVGTVEAVVYTEMPSLPSAKWNTAQILIWTQNLFQRRETELQPVLSGIRPSPQANPLSDDIVNLRKQVAAY